MKKTKLICTIGPASENLTVLKKLIQAGMNGVRMNFSHGSYEQFGKIIKNIRLLSAKMNTPISIIQDLQGPKIRIGKMPENGLKVKKKEIIVLSTTENNYFKKDKHFVPLQYKDLPKDIKLKDPILIDDGKIELEVLKVNKAKTEIECLVKNNGTLYSNKGLNAPKTTLQIKAITPKDLKDLKFGIKQEVDYIALSFVRTANDIIQLRKNLKHIKIIAKIERPEAMQNLKEIVQAADAIMVARGDLGIEIPAALVPIAQKKIIQEANRQGKPVITATHVLNSMIENPLPTRAEISDAANAIFDKTDAIMLSNETAMGRYPVEACQTLQQVAHEIEHEISQNQEIQRLVPNHELETIDAICNNAVDLAYDIKAKYLIALSRSGFTAYQISKNRSYKVEVIIITDDKKTYNQLAIVWGINKIFYVKTIDYQNPIASISSILKRHKLARKKDEIVIVNTVKNSTQRLITTFTVN